MQYPVLCTYMCRRVMCLVVSVYVIKKTGCELLPKCLSTAECRVSWFIYRQRCYSTCSWTYMDWALDPCLSTQCGPQRHLNIITTSTHATLIATHTHFTTALWSLEMRLTCSLHWWLKDCHAQHWLMQLKTQEKPMRAVCRHHSSELCAT